MSIEILAHRGLWSTAIERNSLEALCNALQSGFGIETDVQFQAGELVISHDPPDLTSTPLRALLARYVAMQATTALALNIKCDGLANMLGDLLTQYHIKNYFVFDMSIPDTLAYLRHDMRTFTRQSDYEPQAWLYEECEGVWLDAFENDWYTSGLIKQHLQQNKFVSVVSPELHGRKHQQVWQSLAEVVVEDNEKLMLCTDYPEQFRKSTIHVTN